MELLRNFWDKVTAVFEGKLEVAHYTYRPNPLTTVVTFFEKDRIVTKTITFEFNRRGGAYMSHPSRAKTIVHFKPYIRVRAYTPPMKDEKRGSVRELSYQLSAVYQAFNPERIGEEAYWMLCRYLVHYGYGDTGNLYNAIIPWGKAVREGERLKKPWRCSDINDVLKAAGVPPLKSIKRVLMVDIEGDKHYLPSLDALAFIWQAVNDPNVLTEVYPHVGDDFFGIFNMRDEDKEPILALLNSWHKRTRKAFIINISKQTRWENRLWQDTTRMIMQVYEELGRVPVRARSIKELHDKLSDEINKIQYAHYMLPIGYEESEMALHKLEFVVDKEPYTLILPKNGIEITAWGRELHNCMGSYAQSTIDRTTTLLAVKDKNGKLCVGLEVKYYRLYQISGPCNSPVSSEMRKAVSDILSDHDMVRPDDWETNKAFDRNDPRGPAQHNVDGMPIPAAGQVLGPWDVANNVENGIVAANAEIDIIDDECPF